MAWDHEMTIGAREVGEEPAPRSGYTHLVMKRSSDWFRKDQVAHIAVAAFREPCRRVGVSGQISKVR